MSSVTLDALAELPSRLNELEIQVRQLREELASLQVEQTPSLISVREFCSRYGWTENQVRWLLFHRATNGLSAAVFGHSRLLIDAKKFFEVLRSSPCSSRARARSPRRA